MARSPEVPGLVAEARAGSARAVARLVSLVEDGDPGLREAMAAFAADGVQARLIGITGPPGVGKSTTTSAVVGALRAIGTRIGVLAVDPTSPFSGGALLGDRIRMQEHATDPGVFIRSMASRGHLGGLSRAAPQAARVLAAAGCDVVLIETVGVGQSEVEVAGLADTTVVLVAPGMGDAVQAAKAGILEVGDLFVVNKADRDGAEATARDLRHMISLGPRREPGQWRPPVLTTVASQGLGLGELIQALDAHHAWAVASGELRRRRVRRAAAEIESIATAAMLARMGGPPGASRLEELAGQVAAGRLDAFTASDRLLSDPGWSPLSPGPSPR